MDLRARCHGKLQIDDRSGRDLRDTDFVAVHAELDEVQPLIGFAPEAQLRTKRKRDAIRTALKKLKRFPLLSHSTIRAQQVELLLGKFQCGGVALQRPLDSSRGRAGPLLAQPRRERSADFTSKVYPQRYIERRNQAST